MLANARVSRRALLALSGCAACQLCAGLFYATRVLAPDVIGDFEDGAYEYLLAGGTCLAGDLFGTYAFHEPLDVGSKIVFANAGAYALVKAHYFNGINLPSIYALRAGGDLVLEKKFSYEDFASQCGAVEHENN